MKHEKKFTKLLKGKTVSHVQYMTKDDAKSVMWSSRPALIVFTDGSFIMAQSDDEGNNGGALYYQGKKTSTVIYTVI